MVSDRRREKTGKAPEVWVSGGVLKMRKSEARNDVRPCEPVACDVQSSRSRRL